MDIRFIQLDIEIIFLNQVLQPAALGFLKSLLCTYVRVYTPKEIVNWILNDQFNNFCCSLVVVYGHCCRFNAL